MIGAYFPSPQRVWVALTLLFSVMLAVDGESVIRSKKATDWGDWGPMEECPKGTFVKAINVKVEKDQGGHDDTGMNAVKLSCYPLETQVNSRGFTRPSRVITSTEGPWGDYRGDQFCNGGVAIGFKLRVESPVVKDATATNDMVLMCANKYGIDFTRETGGKMGSWREEVRCPDRMVVCGVQTQVQPSLGGFWSGDPDDTALNNVNLKCCELPSIASSCKPTDKWQIIAVRDNRKGESVMKFSIQQKIGVGRNVESSKSASVLEEISMSVGFGVNTGIPGKLAVNFETKLGTSETTNHAWSRTETSTFIEETTQSINMEILPKCKMTLYELVGICGIYVVNTNSLRREDDCVVDECVTRRKHQVKTLVLS